MGTLLASAFVSSSRVTLLDPSSKTWTDARLLVLLNEGLRRLALLRTDIYTLNGPIALVAGTLQQLPVGGTELFSLLFNTVSGRTIVQADLSLIQEENRWAAPATQQVDVDCFSIDARDKTRFTITPGNTGAGSATGRYGGTPNFATLGTALPIDDIYETPLKYFLLAEAYAADTTRKDLSKAVQYANAATAMLGINAQGQGAASPTPGQP